MVELEGKFWVIRMLMSECKNRVWERDRREGNRVMVRIVGGVMDGS